MIASPLDGAVLYVSPDLERFVLPLTASAPAQTRVVAYTVDGEPEPVGTSDTSPYTVLAARAPATWGLGNHLAQATAVLDWVGPTVVTDEAGFALAEPPAADDLDQNGIPDDPFEALSQPGDCWMTRIVVPGYGNRIVGAVSFEDGATKALNDVPVVMVLESAYEPARKATVRVPRDVLEPGETGVLLVMLGDELSIVFGPDMATGFGPLPDGESLIAGGQFVEVSVLVTTDGGATFTELDEARLAANPIRLTIEGLSFSAGTTQWLHAHSTFVDSNEMGVYIVAEGAAWTTDGVVILEVGEGTLVADLVSLSVFAPFERGGEGEGEGEGETPGCLGVSVAAAPPSSPGARLGDLAVVLLVAGALLTTGMRNARARQ